MKIEKITAYLNENLSEFRLNHTMGVAETAVKLARVYSADANKAYIAALLHDCAKEISVENMIEIVTRNRDFPDEISRNSGALLHGPAGAWLARELYNIDEEVFDAIRYHTTGKAKMNMLTKIVFIADYIEPGRCFDGVDEIRELAFSDIDKAIIMSCSNTIVHTVNKGGVVHPDTVEARNYLLMNNRGADDEKI